MPVPVPPGATVLPSGLILPLPGSAGWADAMNQNLTTLDSFNYRGEVWAESITVNGVRLDTTGNTDMTTWLRTVMPNVRNDNKLLKFGWGRVAISDVIDIPNRWMADFPARPKWMYKGEPPFAFIPKSGVTFAGPAFFRYSQSSFSNEVKNMAFIRNMVCFGGPLSGSADLFGAGGAKVHGLMTDGEVFGLVTEHFGARNFSGIGLNDVAWATGEQSRGNAHLYPTLESNGQAGIMWDGITDSYLLMPHCHYNGVDSTDPESGAIIIKGGGDIKVLGFYMTFNERGIVTANSTAHSAGRPNTANILITDGTSDRTRFGAVEHRATGTRTFNFKACNFGRDGRVDSLVNGSGSGDSVTLDDGSSYAILIDGTVSTPAAPIIFDGCTTQLGTDDSYPAGVTRAPYSSPGDAIKMGINPGYVGWNGGVLAGKYNPYRADINQRKKLFVSIDTTKLGGDVDSPVFSKRHSMLNKRVSWGPQTVTASTFTAAENRLNGTAGLYKFEDLAEIRQVRPEVGVRTAGPAGSTLKFQYTLDLTGASGWTDFPTRTDGTTSSVDISSAGPKGGGAAWIDLPVAAATNVCLRVALVGGDATTSPVFGVIDLALRAHV